MPIINHLGINKLKHWEFNLDYLPNDTTIENQTNKLINDKIQFIVNYYLKNKNDTFILEYNDDLISVIAYNILSRIKVVEGFNFYIYGKVKKTKQYIFKEDKKQFIGNRKIKKLNTPICYLSSFNLIYNVVSDNKYSNKISKIKSLSTYAVTQIDFMKEFTPLELFSAQQFYHIGYINDGMYIKNANILSYSNWLENPASIVLPPCLDRIVKPAELKLLYLDDDMKNNIKLLQDLQDYDNIIMYFYDENDEQITKLLNDFSKWVKYKSNIPKSEFMNINNYPLAIHFYENFDCADFVGNWPTKKMEVIVNEEGIYF